MKKLNKKLSIFSLLIAMAIALMAAVLLINPATAYANSEFSAQNVEKVAMVNGASLRLNSIDDAHRGIRFEGYVNETWYEENGAQAGMLLYKGETAEQLTVDTEGVAKVNSVTWNDAASKQVEGLKYYSVVISEVPAEFNATTVTARAFVMDKEGNFYYADNQPARSMQKVASAAIQDGILDEIDGASSILDAYVEKANTNYYDFEDGVVPTAFTFNAHAGKSTMTVSDEQARTGSKSLKIHNVMTWTGVVITLPQTLVDSINPKTDAIRLSAYVSSANTTVERFNLRAKGTGGSAWISYQDNVAKDQWIDIECVNEAVLTDVKTNGTFNFSLEYKTATGATVSPDAACTCDFYLDDIEIVKDVNQESTVDFERENPYGFNTNYYFRWYGSSGAVHLNNDNIYGNATKKLFVQNYSNGAVFMVSFSDELLNALDSKTDKIRFKIVFDHSTLTGSQQVNLRVRPLRISNRDGTAGGSVSNTNSWVAYENNVTFKEWRTFEGLDAYREAAIEMVKEGKGLEFCAEKLGGASFYIDDIEFVRDTDGDGVYETTIAIAKQKVEDAVKESIGATSKLDKFEIYNAAGENVTATVMDENGYLKVAGNYVVKAYYTDASGITKIFNTKIRL